MMCSRRTRGGGRDYPPLIGDYVGRRECHLESDWLFIYELEGENIIFECTGTHADFFSDLDRTIFPTRRIDESGRLKGKAN
jgi:hypothetical protein